MPDNVTPISSGKKTRSEGRSCEIIRFELAGQHYGVEITSVEECLPMLPVRPVPRSPSYLQGVINLRGEVVPVIELTCVMGLERASIDNESRIIIIKANGKKTGFIVDRAFQVINLEESMIDRSSIDRNIEPFVSGMAKISGGDLIILINLEKVLSEQDISKLASYA